ncbi:histidine phosphatase family protein [Kitasatospora terrestris]|uniref:Histidine phosphatase family protein n=1 Tax=Kitasatospora terrestris TaxID=258051 RepID=A0ABP9E810_9ACTN
MTARVMLLSPPLDDAREPRLGADEPVTGPVHAVLPGARRYATAPSRRCRTTAEALGLDAAPAPELADLDLGDWRGRTLDRLAADTPAGLAAWLADPDAAPHGGESVAALCERVSHWLAGQAATGGRVLAVVDPAVVRAATVTALGLPPATFWRLDVRPLTLTHLTHHNHRWNLLLGTPAT